MKPLALALLLASAPAAGTPAPGEGQQVAVAQRADERRLAPEAESARSPRARTDADGPPQAKREPASPSGAGATEPKGSPPADTGKREDHGGDDR